MAPDTSRPCWWASGWWPRRRGRGLGGPARSAPSWVFAPTFLLMAVGWFWRGDTMGIALGIGIVAMYLVLFGSVRDHGRNLQEVMRLVEDNAELSRIDQAGARPRPRGQRSQDALLRRRQPRPAAAAACAVDQRDHARHPGAGADRSAAQGSEPRHRQRAAAEQRPARRPARHLAPRRPMPSQASSRERSAAILRAAHEEYAALAAQRGPLPRGCRSGRRRSGAGPTATS